MCCCASVLRYLLWIQHPEVKYHSGWKQAQRFVCVSVEMRNAPANWSVFIIWWHTLGKLCAWTILLHSGQILDWEALHTRERRCKVCCRHVLLHSLLHLAQVISMACEAGCICIRFARGLESRSSPIFSLHFYSAASDFVWFLVLF